MVVSFYLLVIQNVKDFFFNADEKRIHFVGSKFSVKMLREARILKLIVTVLLIS